MSTWGDKTYQFMYYFSISSIASTFAPPYSDVLELMWYVIWSDLRMNCRYIYKVDWNKMFKLSFICWRFLKWTLNWSYDLTFQISFEGSLMCQQQQQQEAVQNEDVKQHPVCWDHGYFMQGVYRRSGQTRLLSQAERCFLSVRSYQTRLGGEEPSRCRSIYSKLLSMFRLYYIIF